MRILIVEDEAGIANFLRQGLEEEAYTVDVALDGKSGLAQACSGSYDLLLLDWMLPGMSGIDICRQFRAHDPLTPIIFLTARDTVDETVHGLQAGANDYIKKPFHFEELLERVRVQLRSRTGAETVITLGPIRLDTASYQVSKAGQEVRLTQKEFDLLAYLIQHKGVVCRRSQIIEEVWDIHFDYNTGVIDVYINALRKKLQLTDAAPYIQTVRGVGYLATDGSSD